MRFIAPALLLSALLIAPSCAEDSIVIEKAEREVGVDLFALQPVMTLPISGVISFIDAE